ncbi:MAG: carboxylesterase/lipase family protein [Gammaproteobacteria bacterium]|nr:carboxylesterase/lipase family protein [Gammaproteobacteria bacterium]
MFTGDADNVTIFGESAGGWSVCHLMASPLAAGLFDKAIIQSGGCQTVSTEEFGFDVGKAVSKYYGCHLEADELACLRKLSRVQLNRSFYFLLGKYGIRNIFQFYVPHVDGHALTENPVTAFETGRYNRVPLLAGSNLEEENILSGFLPSPLITKRITRQLNRLFVSADALEEWSYYYHPDSLNRNHFEVFSHALADSLVTCGTFNAVDKAAQYQSDIYYYRFDFHRHNLGNFIGAGHALEIPVVFDNVDKFPFNLFYSKKYRARARPLIDTMSSAWARFARTGNPGDDSLYWPAYDQVSRQRIYFNESIAVGETDIVQKCEFWNRQPRTL